MMIVGFTGTRRGMNGTQISLLHNALYLLKSLDEFHHGDCIGADKQAHNLIRKHFPDCRIVVHPSNVMEARAYCKADFTYKPKPPLIRNHDIVDIVDMLFAAPRLNYEEMRSGTWSTVRYARKTKVVHHICYRIPLLAEG